MIEESDDDGDILTFSILWLSGESDDGDFDFFDIVTEWGVWECCNGNKIKRIYLWTVYTLTDLII